MLLAGMMVSAFAIGAALDPFTPTRLVQVIQGAAVLTVVLNVAALWKQEARNRARTENPGPRPPFADVWRTFIAEEHTTRLLIAVGCGAAAFSMQDVLLEPYGGEILGLGVGQTTALTGLWAAGTLVGFALAGRWLAAGAEPHRIAGLGGVAGIAAFLMILFAAPLASPGLLLAGAGAIGFGAGLFSVGTLTAAMALARSGTSGLALGAWGAVQATCAGLAIALGGILRDLIGSLAASDALGRTLGNRATGYASVYLIEIALLLVTLVVIGPLVRRRDVSPPEPAQRFGLTQFPT
jgi:BCD family chlorophyll transporter-like MFS transporter